uniref:Uncharacterized protein n=1 Tax=Romanomermis culicivorax TaxID=13658 RepID=A0A915L9T3_ROMCU
MIRGYGGTRFRFMIRFSVDKAAISSNSRLSCLMQMALAYTAYLLRDYVNTPLRIGVCAGSGSRFPLAFPACPRRDGGGNGMTFLKAERERAGSVSLRD